ncbi:cysteine desulfurase-like protein [Thioalkalivibrio sp.]|uniref:cysteine desulfurase-like protein n=1 Tax=Thioalkalivibrio sp. TaxID=2093813 RepID=UPI003975736F
MPFSDAQSQQCRDDFPSLKRTVNGQPLAYLDGPGGTQVPQSVINAVSEYYERYNANVGGPFVTSVETDQMMRRSRETVAAFLGAPSWREISFGANMTTLNFALSHALGRAMAPGDEVVITALDHEANRGPWLTLRERGVVVKEVGLRPDATLDPEDLARKIGPRTRLVAIGYSSNAFGTVNDVTLARNLARDVGAYLLVDAVHFVPHFPVDVMALDADFLLCSAYKFYGPHVGILYARPGLLEQFQTDKLRVQYDEAPYRIETGTLNFASIAGTAAAVEYLASWGQGPDLRASLEHSMEDIAAYEHELARTYYEGASAIPGVTIWGPGFDSGRRSPTVSITIDGLHPRDAARQLAEQGLAVWSGHFYALRPIEVLGLADAGGVIRVGISMYNTRAEIELLLEVLESLAA